MNIAMILAGGTGNRLGVDTPKQFIEVAGKPIVAYSLERFQKHPMIDRIVIVADSSWRAYICSWIDKEKAEKVMGFAPAGSSRQHSIANGMAFAKENGAAEKDFVIVHDAARPNVTEALITQCLLELNEADGVMPVLPVKDTIFLSADGKRITSLLNRDQLFAGQTPEGFCFGKYLSAHHGMREEELAAIKGSSELAFKYGMHVRLIPGDERNYKITTRFDLEKFRKEMGETNCESIDIT